VSALDVHLLRLARRRGWLIPVRSRGVPPRDRWPLPFVVETEFLRELFPRARVADLVRTVAIHRARVREALNAPVEFAKAVRR